MGALTQYLQEEFARQCPPGWGSRHEIPLLPRRMERLLGFAPRADVLLEKQDGSSRLWVEFEISRADPVANHTKFLTSHLFEPRPDTDVFVSMVSPHVARGRRNLAAGTIMVMRHMGMKAFQTVLFPHMAASEIKRINHLNRESIAMEGIEVGAEIARALFISEPVLNLPRKRIHFVGDLIEVMLNIHTWNRQMETEEGLEQWGRRTITYFVYDPRSKEFAPTKFCAYTAVPSEIYTGMSIETYAAIDETDRRFDGQKARLHLTKNLGMIPLEASPAERIASRFEGWLEAHGQGVNVHPKGPRFLLPPPWFR